MQDQQERYLAERAKDEMNFQIKWDSFKLDAIERVRNCLENEESICDLINTLDLEWDRTESLENWQINEIIRKSVR